VSLKRLPTIFHQPVYWAIRSIVAVVGAGDLASNIRIARDLGRRFGGARSNRHRLNRAVEHLEIAFPSWSVEQRTEHALLAYEHLFALAMETVSSARLLTADNWPSHVTLGDLGPTMRQLLGDQPSIMLTGHCGNWELLGYTMALLGFPLHALYRPLDLKPADDWVRRSRSAHGLILMDKFGAGEDLPAVFERKGTPAFVADQNAGDRALFVPYFGRLASTYKTIGLLAMQYRAPVICGVALRQDQSSLATSRRSLAAGLSYRIDVIDIILPEEWDAQPDPLFYITARYRRAIEKMVRMAPDQYLWMHRYWKSRPRHERLQREFPGALKDKLLALPWMTTQELETIMEHSARDAVAGAARTKKKGSAAVVQESPLVSQE